MGTYAPMKIAVVMDELPVSSMHNVLGEEVFHLRERGVCAEAYVIMSRPGEMRVAHSESVKPIYIYPPVGSVPRLLGARVPTFSFFAPYAVLPPTPQARRLAERLGHFDVVVAHLAPTNLFLRWFPMKGPKLIYYCHDPIEYLMDVPHAHDWSPARRRILSRIGRLVDKSIMSRADLTILQSKFHLGMVQRSNGLRNVEVLHLGVHLHQRQTRAARDYALLVGRMERGKKPFLALEVLSRLKMSVPGFRLKMVGPWSSEALRDEFMTQARQRGVAEMVQLLGPLDETSLNRVYAESRCLVHFRAEAFGFTALEAASFGVPMVFPKESGVAELFEDGVHGYFPSEDDIDHYCKSLERFWQIPGQAIHFGGAAYERAESASWEAHASGLLQAIDRLT